MSKPEFVYMTVIAAPADAQTFVDGASSVVACHVDTFYETGLIVYALLLAYAARWSAGRATEALRS